MSLTNVFEGSHKGTKYRVQPVNDESCRVTRQSPFGGTFEVVLQVPAQRVKDYYDGKSGMIQQAFPDLLAGDREFIMTGIPPEQFPRG